MPLWIRISRPKRACCACRRLISAWPAVLRSASSGRFVVVPSIAAIRTPFSAVRATLTRSPSASTVCPRMSKPMPTFPTVAGANAVAVSRTSHLEDQSFAPR
jgi:hypothetical protein